MSDRLKPHSRSSSPRRMQEGCNDARIIRLVADYRLLSQKQLESLLDLRPSTLQRLLRRLYDHQYLNRVFLPHSSSGSSPALYTLDRRGVALLRQAGIQVSAISTPTKLSGLFLEHTMAINDFRIAVAGACQRQRWQLHTWHTETIIKADYDRVTIPGQKHSIALLPDGYFCIAKSNGTAAHFFLELDRGTMTSERFTNKIKAYTAYYKCGGFERRYGAKGFRVLTAIAGAGGRRLENLMRATATIPGRGRRFWFTGLDMVAEDAVLDRPIWQVAGQGGYMSLFH